MVRLPICAAALTLVSASPASAGNIVQNGDFETGSFFPWLVPPSVPNQSLGPLNNPAQPIGFE